MGRARLLLAGCVVAAGIVLWLPWAWGALAAVEGLAFLPVALAVLAASAGFGVSALRALGARPVLEGDAAWMVVPLGAGLLGHLQLALAHAQLFGRASSMALLLLGLGLLLLEWRRADGLRPALPPLGAGWAFACAPFLVAVLFLCALPPTGYDALTYHTGLIHQWLARGGAFTSMHVGSSAMPLGAEYAAGTAFAIGGLPEAMGLVFALWLATLAVGAASAARAFFGPTAAGPAAFAAVSAPIATFLTAASKPDLLVTLLFLVALQAARALWDDDANAERRGSAWRVVALALGLAASCKLTALPMILVFALALLAVPATRRSLRADVARLSVPVLVFLAAAAPPYLRNALALGNPVFPFAASLFGGPPWLAHTLQVLNGDAHRAGSLAEVGALVWRAFTATDGTTNEVLGGILLMAVLAPLLLGATRSVQWLGAALLLSLPPWLLSHALPRYDPYLWVCSALLAGAALARLWETRVRWLLVLLLPALALVHASWSLRANELLLRGPSRLLVGAEDREQYLARAIELYPGLRAATAAARARPDGCVFLATGDPRIAHLDAPAVLSEVYVQPALVAVAEGTRDVEEVIQRIRETGATHVLLGKNAARLMAKRGWSLPPHAAQLVDRLPHLAEDTHTILLALPDPRPGRCRI